MVNEIEKRIQHLEREHESFGLNNVDAAELGCLRAMVLVERVKVDTLLKRMNSVAAGNVP